MRNLIIFIVFCLGGYWLYQRYLVPGALPPEPGSGPAPALVNSNSETGSITGGFAMPDPVAWKQVGRFRSKPGIVFVEVALVEGNRWRTEARTIQSSQVIVNVFDGANFVSSVPTITKEVTMDPESRLRNLFSEFNTLRAIGTGMRDGHSCWQFRENTPAEKADGWIDRETHFPVLIEGWSALTGYSEIHFQLLKSDFTILRTTCFDTGNLAPMLTPFLTP
jgi:hypothetical protein